MKHPGFVLCFSSRKGQAFHGYKAVNSLPLETIALRLAAFVTNVSQLVHCKTRVDRGGEGSEGSERQSRGFVRHWSVITIQGQENLAILLPVPPSSPRSNIPCQDLRKPEHKHIRETSPCYHQQIFHSYFYEESQKLLTSRKGLWPKEAEKPYTCWTRN